MHDLLINLVTILWLLAAVAVVCVCGHAGRAYRRLLRRATALLVITALGASAFAALLA